MRAYRIGDPAGQFPVWSAAGARRVGVVTADIVRDWSHPGGEAARRFGRTWYAENRSTLLIVPSVVARMERNIVINTRHADFAGLTVGLETPVWWDQRLFRDSD